MIEIIETNRKINNYGEFLKYSDVFIETGSCYGRSIELAAQAGYKKVYSVEAKEEYYIHCKELVKDWLSPEVHLYHGKSIDKLGKMLKDADNQAVIWLDAHVSGEASAGYGDWMEKQGESDYDQHKALIGELKILLFNKFNNVILIDDQNGWNEHTQEYIDAILAINNSYKFYFFDEQMGNMFYKNKILAAIPNE